MARLFSASPPRSSLSHHLDQPPRGLPPDRSGRSWRDRGRPRDSLRHRPAPVPDRGSRRRVSRQALFLLLNRRQYRLQPASISLRGEPRCAASSSAVRLCRRHPARPRSRPRGEGIHTAVVAKHQLPAGSMRHPDVAKALVRPRTGQEAKAIAGDRGIDAILDNIGPGNGVDNLGLLRPEGGLACIAGIPNLSVVTDLPYSISIHDIGLGEFWPTG